MQFVKRKIYLLPKLYNTSLFLCVEMQIINKINHVKRIPQNNIKHELQNK
jgi:hypothetical protein